MDDKVYTFAVYAFDDSFNPWLVSVTATDEDTAARGAWWAAFDSLRPRGIGPLGDSDVGEGFQVCCWRGNAPGPAVTKDGIHPAYATTHSPV